MVLIQIRLLQIKMFIISPRTLSKKINKKNTVKEAIRKLKLYTREHLFNTKKLGNTAITKFPLLTFIYANLAS